MRIAHATLQPLVLLPRRFVHDREVHGERPLPEPSRKRLEKRLRYPGFASLLLKRAWILSHIYKTADARRQRMAARRDNEAAHKVYESNGFVEDEQFISCVLPIHAD